MDPLDLPEGVKILSHQVAGHIHSATCFGLLERGNIVLKPVQRFPKGNRELEFYEAVNNKNQTDQVFIDIRKFVPKFYGIEYIPISNKNAKYMRLEDITKVFDRPCITDLKIGKQTFNPLANPDKIIKEKSKYPRLPEVGFQILGMRIYDTVTNNYVQYDRVYGRSLAPEDLGDKGLKLYLTQGNCFRVDVLKEIIKQIKEIRDFFQNQTKLSFYSSSLLVVYEGNMKAKKQIPNVALVKMIDFAHVFSTQEHDENYAFGLEILLKLFTNMLPTKI
ncbi:DgyrCDS11908 [Dimorphilus gyrociliatus]|uniref:Kinase n=1 Tax=Dimorphilus gyrociliatus TaxID=2664684 RepID=A0A7I8W6Q6_9ANNE|nr:DgyrCDS11908 [Dimorphilus gyrociliatus]